MPHRVSTLARRNKPSLSPGARLRSSKKLRDGAAECHPSPEVDWFGKSTLKADDHSDHAKNAATVVWTTGGLARLRIEHINLGGSQETLWLDRKSTRLNSSH